jgi:hypothetical protein
MSARRSQSPSRARTLTACKGMRRTRFRLEYPQESYASAALLRTRYHACTTHFERLQAKRSTSHRATQRSTEKSILSTEPGSRAGCKSQSRAAQEAAPAGNHTPHKPAAPLPNRPARGCAACRVRAPPGMRASGPPRDCGTAPRRSHGLTTRLERRPKASVALACKGPLNARLATGVGLSFFLSFAAPRLLHRQAAPHGLQASRVSRPRSGGGSRQQRSALQARFVTGARLSPSPSALLTTRRTCTRRPSQRSGAWAVW